MYSYNLIVKAGKIDDMDALVNRVLVRHFGPAVNYHFHAKLSDEAVVIVSHESKRTIQRILGDWFCEDLPREAPFPEGCLLHYREILPNEPTHISNRLGV
jgi:hypothetical protein